jgi:iron-sulfur cluster repair protein YtfE (RIC family)
VPNLNQLRHEHAELTVISRQLSKMLSHNVPPPAHELYAVRMKLTSALISHLKTEDWVLYPRLLRSSDERVALTARAFSAEMGGLAKEFGDHSNRWGVNDIQDDWEGYRRDTSDILRALKVRMVREERDLYPLLDHRPVEQLTTNKNSLAHQQTQTGQPEVRVASAHRRR